MNDVESFSLAPIQDDAALYDKIMRTEEGRLAVERSKKSILEMEEYIVRANTAFKIEEQFAYVSDTRLILSANSHSVFVPWPDIPGERSAW